jgi:hypothetical protein
MTLSLPKISASQSSDIRIRKLDVSLTVHRCEMCVIKAN